MPLTDPHIYARGASDYRENPTKNFLILAAMVEHGISFGARRYALASYEPADNISLDFNVSDSVELLKGLEPFYRSFIPKMKIFLPIKNNTHAYWTISRLRPDLLEKFSSCIMALYRKKRVREKSLSFGVKLEESRCGGCVKCAEEYIHGVVFGHQCFNRKYMERCLDVLWRTEKETYGGETPNLTQLVDECVDFKFIKKHVPDWASFNPAVDDFLDYAAEI